MPQPSASEVKTKSCNDKLPCIMRIINLSAAGILIGFGVAGIVIMSLNSITSGKFFLIFSPIFMTLTGILFVAAECKIECIMKHFVFMKAYFGRGVFSVFMASSVFYYFSCGADNDVVGWIAGIIIFVTGVFYIIAGTCCYSVFQPKVERQGAKEELIT